MWTWGLNRRGIEGAVVESMGRDLICSEEGNDVVEGGSLVVVLVDYDLEGAKKMEEDGNEGGGLSNSEISSWVVNNIRKIS